MVARENEIVIPTIDSSVEEIKEMMSYHRIKLKQRIQLSNHLEALSAKDNNSSLVKRLKNEIKELKIKGKSRISKAGGKMYRGTLFMATMVATRYNEKMKLFYNRLKKNGKHTTVAQIAVMRKLVIVAHSLFKSEEQYVKTKYLSD